MILRRMFSKNEATVNGDNNLTIQSNGSIIYAYKHSGQVEKAVELAKQLPSYYNSSQDVLRACLEGKELLIHVQHMMMDLAYEFWYSIRQIKDNYAPDEQIALFEKSNAIYDALNATGLKPEQVVHIGDSMSSDVKGASSIGIDTIWVNRRNREVPNGICAVENLLEVFETSFFNKFYLMKSKGD